MTTSLVRIRRGGPQDLPSVAALHSRCTELTLRRRFHGTHPVSERMLRRLLEPEQGWSALAVLGDLVVGMACVGPVSSQAAEIGVLVEDAHQGRGIGTRLLGACLLEATERGFRSMLCAVEPGNDAVLGVVAKIGLPAAQMTDDGVLGIVIDLRYDAAMQRPA